MLRSKTIQDGILTMAVYDFEQKGDVLEPHTHSKVDAHYSIVAAGVLLLRQAGQPDRTLAAGAYVKIDPGVEHSFVALTPRARLFNPLYGGAS